MPNTFVIGDIHGAYKALAQCLQESSFDYENDTLICLGDVCDGWPEVKESVDELLKIKNLVYVLGNHDEFLLDWAVTGATPAMWLQQGGKSTIRSFNKKMDERYIEFFRKAKNFYVLGDSVFTHAGLQIGMPVEEADTHSLAWDRSLVLKAVELKQRKQERQLTLYKNVYLGHTPTINFGSTLPIHACEIWMLDTGAGWGEKLTMLNIDNMEMFQSDPVASLYPKHKGRSRRRII